MSHDPEPAAPVTILQKIVTLQHIHSLYLAAQQSQPPRKDISFNILQLQTMINNNPLINPDFDLLDIKGSLDAIKEKKQSGGAVQNILTPVQIVQVISESLSGDTAEEQVISQVPKSTVFRLSNKVDITLVKDRLIKILNSYKNATLEEITAMEVNFKEKKKEINQIENGNIEDTRLVQEFSKNVEENNDETSKEEIAVDQNSSQQELVNMVKEKLESEDGKEITKVLQDLSENQEKDEKIVLDEEQLEKTLQMAKNEEQEEEKQKPAPKELASPTPEPATPTTPSSGDELRGRKRRGSGSVPPNSTKRFNALSTQLLTQISSNRFASMFMQPVNENEEPDYYKVIRHPVDIKSLGKAIRTKEITTFDELEFELQLMFSNAIMYNDMHQTETYKWTIEMMEEAQNLLNLFRESSS